MHWCIFYYFTSVYFQDYSTEGMSESLLVFLQHLREFGLVYQRKVIFSNNVDFKISFLIFLQRKAGRFYPTRLALDIASGKGCVVRDASNPGYIIVETNYRVYAYTENNLQVALIGIFTDLLLR